MFSILLVEDDPKIREVIVDYFEGKNSGESEDYHFSIDQADNGDDGLAMVYENNYDLVLLDIMLPGENGFNICKAIRRESDIPIIFLTAKSRQEDVMYGYDLGCDDYVTKPFNLPQLYAKSKALINRTKGTVVARDIVVGSISINPATMRVTVDGQNLELTPKEYVLLKILMENKNNAMSRDSLLTRVWGFDYEGNERVLDNHIKKLRKLLGVNGSKIKTIIRYGYKIVE